MDQVCIKINFDRVSEANEDLGGNFAIWFCMFVGSLRLFELNFRTIHIHEIQAQGNDSFYDFVVHDKLDRAIDAFAVFLVEKYLYVLTYFS